MITQPELLRYPQHPGSKVSHGPSADAATDMASRAETLRAKVLRLLRSGASTADECAARMSETVLAVRPRLSELVAKGQIVDRGERRPNSSGKKATVWRIA